MLKFLRVNTNKRTVVCEDVKEEYTLFGGRSLIAKILNDEVDPACDPISSSNKLIICGGLLNGTVASTSGRISIGGKSPLTGTIKEANAGGIAGQMLAKLGLKAIIVENSLASAEWSILRVTKDKAELLPAAQYVGLNNYALTNQLKQDFGQNIGVISIGGAGERGYQNSTVQITDMLGYPSRSAARGGLGAVMGSKGIKAIVLAADGLADVEYVDKVKFINSHRKFVEGIRSNPVSGQLLPALGTAGLVNLSLIHI